MGGGDAKPRMDTGIQSRVNDANAAHALIASRGGEVTALNSGEDGTIDFAAIDPDGNKIGIAQIPAEVTG